MKLHIKTLLLATFFALAALGLQAQEKYDYLVIEAGSDVRRIYISKAGAEYKYIDLEKEETFKLGVVNMVMKEIRRLEDEGWELWDSDFTS